MMSSARSRAQARHVLSRPRTRRYLRRTFRNSLLQVSLAAQHSKLTVVRWVPAHARFMRESRLRWPSYVNSLIGGR
jgi:hypothetical protein